MRSRTAPPVRATRHPCAAVGCDRMILLRHLMCRSHWHLVPPDLQRRVYATYNAVRTRAGDEDLLDYDEAVTAAVRAVSDHGGRA